MVEKWRAAADEDDGTTVSPWRYDLEACDTLQSASLRCPAI
jgi:hypothetical protein